MFTKVVGPKLVSWVIHLKPESGRRVGEGSSSDTTDKRGETKVHMSDKSDKNFYFF